jgi:hypothetical protein
MKRLIALALFLVGSVAVICLPAWAGEARDLRAKIKTGQMKDRAAIEKLVGRPGTCTQLPGRDVEWQHPDGSVSRLSSVGGGVTTWSFRGKSESTATRNSGLFAELQAEAKEEAARERRRLTDPSSGVQIVRALKAFGEADAKTVWEGEVVDCRWNFPDFSVLTATFKDGSLSGTGAVGGS